MLKRLRIFRTRVLHTEINFCVLLVPYVKTDSRKISRSPHENYAKPAKLKAGEAERIHEAKKRPKNTLIPFHQVTCVENFASALAVIYSFN